MKKKEIKKYYLKFLPFLFVIIMVIFLIINSANIFLSPPTFPKIEDQNAATGISFFALFVSISFIISMVILFIIYYILRNRSK